MGNNGRVKVNTRSYFQLGDGANWAPESQLGLSGANNEELSENKYTRTNGIICSEMMSFGNEIGNFQMGGGLNLRGYTSYLAPEYNENGELIRNTNYGTSGASFTTEIDVSSYLPYSIVRKGIGTYLFADAGIINTEEINRNNYTTAWTDVRTDAGYRIYLHTQKLGAIRNNISISYQIRFSTIFKQTTLWRRVHSNEMDPRNWENILNEKNNSNWRSRIYWFAHCS